MSRMFITALITLFFAGCALYETIPPAQYGTIKPQKGHRSIIINSDLDTKDLYRKIGQGLSHQGYSIQNSDSELLTINSGWKELAQKVHIKINASIQTTDSGSTARLNGLWIDTAFQSAFGVESEGKSIEYSKNGFPWAGLHNFATALFDLDQISYE